MRTLVLAALSLALASGASAQQSSQVEQDYAAGRLANAAEALAAQHGPSSDAERLIACRLSLYSNHLVEARACSAALLGAAPQDRAVLQIVAETDWRAGDFVGAADARTRLGSNAAGQRLTWFATSPPYAHARLHDDTIAFVRVDPLPVIGVRLKDGPQLYFILDTGAGDTVIDRSLVEAAHIRVFGDQSGVFGGGQTAQTALGVAPSLRIGATELHNVPVVVLDTSAYGSAAPGLHISGVIGAGLLSRFVSTIDYRHNRLVLRAHRARAAPNDVVARFWLFNDHYIITEARVNDHPYAAFIDTGLAGSACTAPRSTIDTLGVSLGDAGQGGANGAGQAVDVAPFHAALAIGAAAMSEAPCLFGPFPPQLEAIGGSHIGVLISHAFFRPFALTLDFQAMELVISR